MSTGSTTYPSAGAVVPDINLTTFKRWMQDFSPLLTSALGLCLLLGHWMTSWQTIRNAKLLHGITSRNSEDLHVLHFRSHHQYAYLFVASEHFLNSTMLKSGLQQIFGLIPSTVSRYISFSLKILLETLCQIPDAAIQWPRTLQEFQSYSDLITACHPRLHGAFASIDGLNLITQTSDDVDIENATYNGWLSAHFISSVIVFAPDGMMFH